MVNILPLSKKVRVCKWTEEKEKMMLCHWKEILKGLAKTLEAIGMATKVIAQVNTSDPILGKGIHTPVSYTAGRIPQRIFTWGKATRMKEVEKKKGKNEADKAHGSVGQLSWPSVWERIQVVDPFHLANSFKPLAKFVN